jgi:hypothetical protein
LRKRYKEAEVLEKKKKREKEIKKEQPWRPQSWLALSYIHVVIPINISGLLQAIHDFRSKAVTKNKIHQ